MKIIFELLQDDLLDTSSYQQYNIYHFYIITCLNLLVQMLFILLYFCIYGIFGIVYSCILIDYHAKLYKLRNGKQN